MNFHSLDLSFVSGFVYSVRMAILTAAVLVGLLLVLDVAGKSIPATRRPAIRKGSLFHTRLWSFLASLGVVEPSRTPTRCRPALAAGDTSEQEKRTEDTIILPLFAADGGSGSDEILGSPPRLSLNLSTKLLSEYISSLRRKKHARQQLERSMARLGNAG